MLDRFLLDWNQVAGVMVAFVNAFPASVVVTALAWGFMLARKNWTAASRYWVWWMVLAFIVAMPAAHPFLPDHSKPLLTGTHEGVSGKHVSAVDSNSVAPAAANPSFRIENSESSSRFTISGILLWIWILAAAIQFARLVLAFRNTRNLKRSAIEPTAELQRKWHERLEAYALGRPVALGLSAEIATPAVTGYAHPSVLLPVPVADHLSGDELDQILSHELAHIRRYDDWAIALQRCLEAVLVLHPLVRLIAKRIELEREVACDDCVLSTQRPQGYASCLAKLAELRVVARPNRLATAAMERKSQLSRRIEMLLDGTRSIATRASVRSLGSIAIILLMLAFMSLRLPRLMAYPVAPQAPAPPEAPAPPQAPVAPKPPAVAESHPAPQGPSPPPAPVAPPSPAPPQALAPPQAPQDVDAIIIYSEDGHASVYQNRGSGEISVRPGADKAGSIEVRRNRNSYVIRDPDTVRAAEEAISSSQADRATLGELEREMMRLQKQAKLSQPQLDRKAFEELSREMKSLQDETRHLDLDKLKSEMKRAQDEVSHLNPDETRRATAEVQRMLAELSEAAKTSEREMQSKFLEDQSRAARQARERLNELIDRAVRNGLAQPAR